MTTTGPKHRVLRGMLLAIALFLLFGGALGFAATGDDTQLEFAVLKPAGGDQAVYEGLGTHGGPYRLEVSPVRPFLLEDGSWSAAHDVNYTIDNAISSDSSSPLATFSVSIRTVVDVATDSSIASSGPMASGSFSMSTSCGLPFFLMCTQSRSSDWTTTLSYNPAPLPCGFRSSLQGWTGTLGDKVMVDGCGLNGERLAFRVVGLLDLVGTPSLVVENQKLGLTLWYWPAIPYPVQFQTDDSTFRLTHFKGGASPLEAVPLPPPLILPSVLLARTGQLGPSTDGFAQPFPIAAAVEQERQSSSELRSFLSRHPDYFLTQADYRETEKDGEITREWAMALHGGAESFRFAVDQKEEPVAQEPEPVQDFVAQTPVGGGLWHAEPDQEWPPQCRPKSLPTVASVAALWAARESRKATDGNSWSLQLQCFTEEGGLHPSAVFSVGDARTVYPPSPGTPPFQQGSTNATQFLTMLAVDGFGAFSHLELSAVTTARESSSNLPVAAAPQSNAEPISSVEPGTWGWPPAPAAASVGIFSVLAGLVYALWPTLKGGVFSLFSRVRRPDVLKHALRAEMMRRIEAHPGIHYQELVRTMGLGKGSVEHHLEKLRASGLIVAQAAGGYTCFFPARTDRRVAAAAPVLKSDGARRILAVIHGTPGLSALDVGNFTALSPGTVNHHLQRLSAAGLVVATREGRRLHLEATLLGQALAVTS